MATTPPGQNSSEEIAMVLDSNDWRFTHAANFASDAKESRNYDNRAIERRGYADVTMTEWWLMLATEAMERIVVE